MVVVECDEDAASMRPAHAACVPVALGRGDDRATLLLLGVPRRAVVAGVTSDDLSNVAVGLAAHGIAPATPLVLRLGDGDVTAETGSLLHLGRICDIHDAVVAGLAAEIAGAPGRELPTS